MIRNYVDEDQILMTACRGVTAQLAPSRTELLRGMSSQSLCGVP